MRFQGKSRLGFYPLPLSEAQRIRKFLQFPVTPSSALDPWVGDGLAFEAITNDAEVLRYGIELDAYRAEQSKQRIPNVIQGNALEVQCVVECSGLQFLNSVLRQNAIMMHALQKQPPKDRSLCPSRCASVSGPLGGTYFRISKISTLCSGGR